MNTNKPKLIILCAPSGSGKSTVAKDYLAQNPSTVYLCPDSMRGCLTGDESRQDVNSSVFHFITQMCRYFMYLKKDILIDATHCNKRWRKDWIRFAKEHHYEIIALTFETTLAEALVRNEGRDRRVPIEVITRQFDNFQKPELEEGFDKIVNSDDYMREIIYDDLAPFLEQAAIDTFKELDSEENQQKGYYRAELGL